MLIQFLAVFLIPHIIDCTVFDSPMFKALFRKKRFVDDDEDDIYMFRNPNITIPKNRSRITFKPEWLYYTMSPKTTAYYGQKGLIKEWTTYAWFNDRVTVYLDMFLKGLRDGPITEFPRRRKPSTLPLSTTLEPFLEMTLYNKKDLIFKLPWAYAPHANFRKEMGFGPNDTIDMSKVSLRTIQAFEQKYKVTVMYQWPNTHPAYLKYLDYQKWNHTLVFSDEMTTQVPLNYSYVQFEDWFAPQAPRMKLTKVENLMNQLRILLEDQFELENLDRLVFNDEIPHDELVKRYNRFRNLRKREYRTWFRRKIYLPWKYLVRDGIREWFLAQGKCVPSPGKIYFDEINRQFEQLGDELNVTLYGYINEMETAFLHWYAHTYAARWNLSMEEEDPTMPFTILTRFSPVTESDEFYILEKPGIQALE